MAPTQRNQSHRTTAAEAPPGTTLFLIGMRVRRPWRVLDWWRSAVAMPRMLAHLSRDQEAGLLSYDLYLGRSALVVCYWRDPESLRRFAADRSAPHARAWRWFNKQVAGRGSVGIWHETYVIGTHESIYGDMPAHGLGRAVGVRHIDEGTATFRQRIVQNDPSV